MSPSLPGQREAGSSASLLGELIAERYRIEELLGEGGMGAVYRATHVQLQKSVALKVLHAHMTEVEEAVLRFEREAVASARVEHANVVNATDFGRLPDGSFFLVLEYVAGQSLRDRIDKGPLPEIRALHIAKQITQALSAAHAHGIIHRDLKPDNVMLVEKDGDPDFVKVLDFGIAKLSSATEVRGTALTRFGTVFGTPQYMAPEQAAGRTVDARADLYAVGVILHEMLCGRPPFEADDLLVLLTQQMTQPPPPLPSWVSTSTSQLVLQLLEKEPEARVQSAGDLLAHLSGQIIPRSGVRKRLQSAGDFAQSWGKRPQIKVALLALAAVGMLIAIVLTLTQGSNPGKAPVGASLAEQISPDANELLDRALKGDAKALIELQTLANEAPTAVHWLALGRAQKGAGKFSEALVAYSAAVKNDPTATSDPSLLSDFRQLAVNSAVSEQALSFAASDLGASGIDLLIDVWLGEQGATVPAQRAKKLLEDVELRKRASPAAKLAIELRELKGCQAFNEILPRAKLEADERSVIPLRRLLERRGCGFLSLSDCYGCLRGSRDLTETVAAAQGRSAPKFFVQSPSLPSGAAGAPSSHSVP